MTLTRRPAIDLAADLHRRTLSAVELMTETLAQIDAVNGEVNAIVALREPDALLEEARACDAAGPRGPLHGIPVAVKDLVNVAGVRSTMGSPMLADFVPEADDLIAARMRGAGAILIGKTNTPEFGLGSHTFNPVYGATRNPYDLTRSCGGSSGGAAVSLATGMLALADGSDMMGSLRNPAGWNNVYGFRPSWGRVPSDPVGDMFLHQLSTLGPMARSPKDIALLLDVISGPDPRLPLAAPADPVRELVPRDLTGLRFGWLADWGGACPFEPGILDLCRAAARALEDRGATVTDLAPPFSADALWDSWTTLRSWSVAASIAPLRDAGAEMKDTAIWELERGLAMSAMEIHRASVLRSDWFRAAATCFETYDALILPSAQVWPFDLNLPYPTEIAGVAMDTYHRWMQVMIPAGLIGLPCLNLPAGFGMAGLPMGIQLFGPRGADRRLLEIGATYHEATFWPQTFPAFERPQFEREAIS